MKRLESDGVVSLEDMPYIDFNLFRDYVAGRKGAKDAFSEDLIEKKSSATLVKYTQ